MNELHHHVITIQFDVWQPFYKDYQKELDEMISMLKTKKLLAHAGNVKTNIQETE